jgi:hypothetical protein
MKGSLIIIVTKSDAEIGGRVFGFANGLDQTYLKQFWKADDFGSYDGGGTHPLTLVGHANVSNFIKDMDTPLGPARYISGDTVANQLIARKLQATTFPFCLIAGCSAAERSGRSGLYINVGDVLGIPVVASTTPMALGARGGAGFLQMTPQDGGIWKVYYPAEQEVQALSSSRCGEIAAALQRYVLRP